jgi:trans-aconitate 2-methyltransferase
MWNPEDYAKNSDAQLKWAQELRSRLDLKGDEIVLDVGCGDGKITADFAAALAQGKVVGVDSSPEMIAYAQRTYPQSQHSNLTFACEDARSLSFEPVFDLVFSNATLHWVGDHPAFLRGAYQALRSSGKLIISCGGQGNAAAVLQVFATVMAQPPWQPYFVDFPNPYFFHGLEEYGQWLPAAGFGIQRLELVPKDMTHTGAEGLAAWIRTTWMPFTHCVPEPDRDRFIADFMQSYLSRHPIDSDGRTHVSMVRLEVEAEKIGQA